MSAISYDEFLELYLEVSMIIINTDFGLVPVESWDDVLSLPNYTPDLDSKQHELATIIGRYLFRERVRCGLSNCHTPHEKGYVVTTKTGAVTNIGKDCGAKYFGVDFEDMTRKFDRDLHEREMREQLTSFMFQIEFLEERLHEIRRSTKGADWMHKSIHALQMIGGNVPAGVVRRLGAMVRSGSGVINLSREATAAEVDAARSMGVKISMPYYVDEPVGEIVGIQAMYPEYDLRKLLVLEVDEKLKEFKTKNIDTLTYDQLKEWAKWQGGIDRVLDSVNEAIAYGHRLLTRENLCQFNKVLSKSEIEQFRGFLQVL
jgi:hypothetical protein